VSQSSVVKVKKSGLESGLCSAVCGTYSRVAGERLRACRHVAWRHVRLLNGLRRTGSRLEKYCNNCNNNNYSTICFVAFVLSGSVAGYVRCCLAD